MAGGSAAPALLAGLPRDAGGREAREVDPEETGMSVLEAAAAEVALEREEEGAVGEAMSQWDL